MRRRLTAALAATAAGVALAAAPAAAHVQVRPAEAAPGDPVLWTVLVPNEQDVATTRVELAIPDGVLPFAYEPLPGWTRRVTKNPDQSTRSVVWTGRLEPEEVLSTQFLATTPDAEGSISWKAIQTYADGKKVRWIGGPDTEEPAAVTQITASAPRENAGGEAAAAEATPAGAAEQEQEQEDEGGDGLAIAALAVGLLALVVSGVALLRARGRRG
ncbi:DUF1775 domain-containing protein [Svornostia abyssi]|uniref:DUF1775 domain-containing protein n=1 Tax=Svornostia abyssi TaxID=2898438 RepID=A0ABY5PP62_9ACTN|nr:DUF1775 domain-containing protein [Parviterribacteraceae bacterium J379]